MTEFKDTTNRHLRHKLQSLGRRLDELEEATSKLQKAEDELLDLQDKIIQAEGSNSSLLGDVEALRKRVLKIEGKDEEVRKAEDLCRLIQEKLEEEENLTKELRTEIECLQLRMTELEKLEEAFGKSKSDCTQLCLSLNEEKNLTKKLSAELEALKARVKEVDSSEASLNRAEQALTAEMEKLKSFTKTFVMERKKLLEKQREDEKIILKLTEKLEHQKSEVGSLDHGINESLDLIIDDDLSPGLSSKLGRKKKLSHDVGLRNKFQNEKNSLEGQEDNKIKDLTQEVENLKSRLKQLEMVEADLKNTELKNAELDHKFQQERIRNQVLSDQLEQLLLSNNSNIGTLIVSSTTGAVENGKAEAEDISIQGSLKQEKKSKFLPFSEVVYPKYKKRDNSPQQPKLKSKEVGQSAEKSPVRRPQSPAHRPKKTGLKSGSLSHADTGVKYSDSTEEKPGSTIQATSNASSDKKVSVLSRYPPATSDQKPGKASVKPSSTEGKKATRVVSQAEKDRLNEIESSGPLQVVTPVLSLSQPNGSYTPYRSHLNSAGIINHRSDGHSTVSETQATGSKPSVGDKDAASGISVLSGRATDSKHPRYSRLQDSQSGGSSTKSSYDEEKHRAQMMEGGSQEPLQTGIEIQRVCSPRESLCSKVLIKPAIIEYDKKEMMSGGSMEPMHIGDKPKIAMKPSKMTSSITFYPNDPSSSRTSSRNSSVSSEPSSKERHTSTSNIVIGPNTEHRGNIAIPYEISIPKSEITLMSGDGDSDSSDLPSAMETARIETTILSRSSLNFQSPEISFDLNSEPGFESSGSTSTSIAVTNLRSPTNDQCSSQDVNVPEMRNITIRSGWRNRGAVSADQLVQGPRHDGLEDETESTTTWRAYRATTVLDTEETSSNVSSRSVKPSPAERYMRRISTGNISRDLQEPSRRNKSGSPIDSSLQRVISHEPVCAQQLQPRIRKEPPAVDESEQSLTSLRRQPAGEVNSSGRLGGRGAWTSKASIGGDGNRHWSSRQHNN